MEQKSMNIPQRTPEEIRAWFYQAKARLAAKEAKIRAMYEEERRMKEEAEKNHRYEFEFV